MGRAHKKFIPFEPDIYKFRFINATDAISKTSGAKMVTIRLELQKNIREYIVTDYMTLLYVQRIEDFFRATGKKVPQKISSITPRDFEFEGWGLANVGTVIFQGKKRPKILNYLPQEKNKCLTKMN